MTLDKAQQILQEILSKGNVYIDYESPDVVLIEFCDYPSNGWLADGVFGCYADHLTYNVYWESELKHLGPFEGTHTYDDNLKSWCEDILTADFVEAK